MREETQLAQCCITHKCNTGIISAIMLSTSWKFFLFFFFFIISTEVDRHVPKFRFCASSSSSTGVHSYSTGSLSTRLPGSATHYTFSSTPTHSTFFSLDCSPLCPIYCSTAPVVLLPKPKIVASFLPPSSFLTSSNPLHPSRSPSTAYLF